MSIAQDYLKGLKKAYFRHGAGEEWERFQRLIHGASQEELEQLKALYPLVPDSLLQLLQFADGTYWRVYQNTKVAFYFLGSDLEEFPYYLLSAKEMMEHKQLAFEWYGDFVNRVFGTDLVDEKIIEQAEEMCWLHFADCMNNGGSSQLFIDFSPSPKGKPGQIVRFLHDPDELQVIADSFDDYLQKLMKRGFDFINQDTANDASFLPQPQ